MRKKPDPSEIVEVYIDESSQNDHRHLVIGAVVLELGDSPKLNQLILAARLPQLPDKEAKWTKVSTAKLGAYKRIADVVFDNSNLIHFHCLFVDTTQINDRKFNSGSREIGFNKEVYQLALKVARLYKSGFFHLYPDRRETKQRPEDLRLMLNRGCRKVGDQRDWPFRRCQFRDSKKTLLLQLTDILVGAIAFQLNGHAKAPNASRAKRELSEYILKKAGIADLTKGTARAATFSVWPRKLR
jgi:hypothetical protein